MPRKRLNYFKYQFLEAADFKAEQDYHLEMRRLHNQALHTNGVARGLQVKKKDNKSVTVMSGVAIDGSGREIELSADFDISLSDATKYPPGSEIFVAIAYDQKATDPQPADKPLGDTRITEEPKEPEAITRKPENSDFVLLASFRLDAAGNVPGSDGDSFENNRQIASAKIAPGAINTAQIAPRAINTAQIQNQAVTPEKLASPRQFLVGTAKDGDVISPPQGKVTDWVIFVSPRKIHATTFIFGIEVYAEESPTGWTIRCSGFITAPLTTGGDVRKVSGEVNYMLLKK